MRTIAILIMVALLGGNVVAQEADSAEGQAEPERGFVPIPALGYSPEMWFIFGLAAIYFSVPSDSDDQLNSTNLATNLQVMRNRTSGIDFTDIDFNYDFSISTLEQQRKHCCLPYFHKHLVSTDGQIDKFIVLGETTFEDNDVPTGVEAGKLSKGLKRDDTARLNRLPCRNTEIF